FLVSVDSGEFDCEMSINELYELCKTAKINVTGSTIQKRDNPDTKTFVGEGKLKEIKDFSINNEVNLLIFDGELSAVQLRNIEKETELAIIDRTTLILDIFATRAITSEGKLQVELAQQKYRLPRLAGMGTALSKLGGSASGAGVGSRGPGETKLETDRRYIRDKIHSLEEKAKELSQKRELTRRKRIKSETPTISITGYTNAGKSTLLNYLTDAGVLSENMLFATLDPTARSLELPSGQSAIIIDTVGFISRLPHHLIKAFKSTLEEATLADITLLVCDASDENCSVKRDISKNLLIELGCEQEKILTVYNKCDIAENMEISSLKDDDVAYISAISGFGIEDLISKIDKKLDLGYKKMTLHIPYDKTGLISKIRENGKILKEEYQDEYILVDGIIDRKLLKEFSIYEKV
ncbi:MAG: GTPase HflX, partial [Clostridia bacterium]